LRFDCILFDLDGTLWDSVDGICTAWNRGLVQHGLAPLLTREKLIGQMGKLLPDIAAALLPDLAPERRTALLEACCGIENDYLAREGGTLYPGVPQTLERLSGQVPLAIVSNCQGGYIESFFAAHSLRSYFSDYENPGRTGLDKAGNIRLVVERNSWKNPVYVGDTQGDCTAAAAAGVPFVHAAYGFGAVEGALPRLERFSDLPVLLETL